ncbi:MAG: hypothetical protein P1V18_04180 [Candidatus Gracilibacteria bacterium]|nr:hypothetical protein [Candidatus Gracilibacteria bacterium]
MEKIQSLVLETLKVGGFPVQDVEIIDLGDGENIINLVSDGDTNTLIGHRGEVLWALQHIIKNMLRTQGFLQEGVHFKVDVDSYKQKQEANVMDRAEEAAKGVLDTGKPVVLPPMAPYFRRLCHLRISEKFPELKTESQGSANSRSVKIYKEGAKEIVPDVPETDIYDNLEL